MTSEWLRFEEERHYTGPTEADVARAFQSELSVALREGYIPTTLRWSHDVAEPGLMVTYEYAPDRAPRPV